MRRTPSNHTPLADSLPVTSVFKPAGSLADMTRSMDGERKAMLT